MEVFVVNHDPKTWQSEDGFYDEPEGKETKLVKVADYWLFNICNRLDTYHSDTLGRNAREHGMSNASFYKWQAKYGGMDASLISQMKATRAAVLSRNQPTAEWLVADRVQDVDGHRVWSLD